MLYDFSMNTGLFSSRSFPNIDLPDSPSVADIQQVAARDGFFGTNDPNDIVVQRNGTGFVLQSRSQMTTGTLMPSTTSTTTTTFADPSATVSPLMQTITYASVAAGAYHGYKRNNSVGWAIWWALMGGIFPIVTPAIAIAQGFGKPISATRNNPAGLPMRRASSVSSSHARRNPYSQDTRQILVAISKMKRRDRGNFRAAQESFSKGDFETLAFLVEGYRPRRTSSSDTDVHNTFNHLKKHMRPNTLAGALR